MWIKSSDNRSSGNRARASLSLWFQVQHSPFYTNLDICSQDWDFSTGLWCQYWHYCQFCLFVKNPNVFTPVRYSVHRGICLWGSLPRGVCIQGGSACGEGVCPGRALHPGGCLGSGVCIQGGLPSRGLHPGGLRSTSGRYTSYWNILHEGFLCRI